MFSRNKIFQFKTCLTKKSSKGIILLLIFLCTALPSKAFVVKQNEAWMDSAISEGIRKIGYAEALRRNECAPSTWEIINHYNRTENFIVIDLAKWTPTLNSTQFYYEKTNSPQFFPNGNSQYHIWDSLIAYNSDYGTRPDFVSYYNIVLKNFPLELRKDISTVKTEEGSNLYSQLHALGAIKNEDYAESLNKFVTIIDNISILAQNNFQLGKIVCFGSANLLGQYGKKADMRASFGAYYVSQSGFVNPEPWLTDLVKIPKYMCPPIPEINPPSLQEKNFQIALAIEHYIECNAYGDCNMNSEVFSNQYAKWLFDNLKDAPNISKPLLLNTCIKLNQLPHELAWSVLTVDYENDFASYAYTPLGFLYTFYTDSTLRTIARYTNQIVRGKQQFAENGNLVRDSALYYGRFLYRIPSYMQTISTSQRTKLLKSIAASSCSDIEAGPEASYYQNHCERICKSLYTNLPAGEERSFMDAIKANGVIWDLSYRLDNMTFGFFGDDNYTDFIFTISGYWQKAYPEKSRPATGSGVNFFVYKWDDGFFNSNGWIIPNHSANTITEANIIRQGASVYNLSGTANISDIYDPVMIHPTEGSVIPGNEGIREMVVPAIFLDWLSHKKTLADIATYTKVTLSALALASGIGEFYEATSVTMKVVSAIQVAISASDLILLNENVKSSIIGLFPSPQEGQAFLEAYQNITMAINVAAIGKGLLTNWNNDVHLFSNRFDSEEQAIKGLLGESSAEFQGMKKLRGELGVVEEVVVSSISQRSSFWENWIEKCFPGKNWSNTTFKTIGEDYNTFKTSNTVTYNEMKALNSNEIKLQEVVEAGSTNPIKIQVNHGDVFYKIVPQGGNINSASVYYIDQIQYNLIKAEPQKLEQLLGLPLGSVSAEYDVFQITFEGNNGYVFQSTVAPTEQYANATPNLKYNTSGGGTQTLILDNLDVGKWNKGTIPIETISPNGLPQIGN